MRHLVIASFIFFNTPTAFGGDRYIACERETNEDFEMLEMVYLDFATDVTLSTRVAATGEDVTIHFSPTSDDSGTLDVAVGRAGERPIQFLTEVDIDYYTPFLTIDRSTADELDVLRCFFTD